MSVGGVVLDGDKDSMCDRNRAWNLVGAKGKRSGVLSKVSLLIVETVELDLFERRRGGGSYLGGKDESCLR